MRVFPKPPQAVTWHRDAYRAFDRDAMAWHVRQPGNTEPPCAYEHVTGRSLWDTFRSDPAAEASFGRGMTSADAIGGFSGPFPSLVP